eukprot:Hpha_TRINITY_DN35634_c0_g1::TRINITY_DN35634_c0_g1_i1::g.68562::m.68562
MLPPHATSNEVSLATSSTPRGEEQTKERHRATVIQVGAEPLLHVEDIGEVRFAYRAVKKKPGEARAVIVVGDQVECRLTRSPRKAVSVRLLRSGPPPPAAAAAAQAAARAGTSLAQQAAQCRGPTSTPPPAVESPPTPPVPVPVPSSSVSCSGSMGSMSSSPNSYRHDPYADNYSPELFHHQVPHTEAYPQYPQYPQFMHPSMMPPMMHEHVGMIPPAGALPTYGYFGFGGGFAPSPPVKEAAPLPLYESEEDEEVTKTPAAPSLPRGRTADRMARLSRVHSEPPARSSSSLGL